jgi:hypothetical protein
MSDLRIKDTSPLVDIKPRAALEPKTQTGRASHPSAAPFGLTARTAGGHPGAHSSAAPRTRLLRFNERSVATLSSFPFPGAKSLPDTSPPLETLFDSEEEEDEEMTSFEVVFRKEEVTSEEKPEVAPRLTDEALAKTVPQRSTTQIHPDDIPLAGYLLARQADRRPVEGEDLALLRDAHDSVREARNLMPLGRGNVREDNAATHGLSLFAALEGRAQEDLTMAEHAVLAGAGACAEHSELAAQAMANRMGPQVKARLTHRTAVDHQWTEASASGNFKDRAHTVALDAWRAGPAVFAPDSVHAGRSVGLKSIKDDEFVDRRYFTAAQHGGWIDDAKKVAQQRSAEGKGIDLPTEHKYPADKMLESRSGVDPRFAKRAAARLDKEVSPDEAYTKASKSTAKKVGAKLSKIGGGIASMLGLGKSKSPKSEPASSSKKEPPVAGQLQTAADPSSNVETRTSPTLAELMKRDDIETANHRTLAELMKQDDAEASQVAEQRQARPIAPTRAEIREAEKTQRPLPAALRAEIQAVGIARELAPEMSMKDLAGVAPKIAEAARTLAEAGPTKATHPFAPPTGSSQP